MSLQQFEIVYYVMITMEMNFILLYRKSTHLQSNISLSSKNVLDISYAIFYLFIYATKRSF